MSADASAPRAITPTYWAAGNEQLVLYAGGPIAVSRAGSTALLEGGEVYWRWLPRPRAFYRGGIEGGGIPEALDPMIEGDVTISLPNATPDTLIQDRGLLGEPDRSRFTLWTHDAPLINFDFGHPNDLRRLTFNIINGPRTPTDNAPIEVEVDGWRLRVAIRPDWFSVWRNELRQTGGFAFTHAVELVRSDGSPFTVADAAPVVDGLRLMLRFAGARSCGTALEVGFDASGDPTWTQWGVDIVDGYRSAISWYDEDQDLSHLLENFIRLRSDPFWGDVIRRAVAYYVAANDTYGIDRSIITAQAGLELLAWAVLVQHEKWLEADQRLRASGRLRLLLKWCGLPAEIPPGFTALHRISALWRGNVSPDGPLLVNRIRNTRIHPTASDAAIDIDVLAQTWRLAQWYFEAALLRIARYRGAYLNRSVMQVEPAPSGPSATV